MKTVRLITITLFIVSFFSCDKKEEPISPPKLNPESEIIEISISDKYGYQVFFDLEDYIEVSRNEKTTWDLGAKNIDGKIYINLNSSKYMNAVASTKSWEETTDYDGLELSPDSPDGKISSLVIGNNLNEVFILDMGFNSIPEALGYKKVKFQVVRNSLRVISADLDGINESVVNILINNELSFTPFSLSKSTPSDLHPISDEWDILFTQYTHIYANGRTYLVAGVLLNTVLIEASVDSINTFENINKSTAKELDFSSDQDIIGFDWKTYSFETSSYTVDYEKYFILKKDAEYYKLRFIDFYDNQGNKGNFEFEIQKLN